jgi:hypothetical protein
MCSSAAPQEGTGVVLFSCSTEGRLVLCCSTTLQEGSWGFAVQLLIGKQLVSCSSTAPQKGSLSCAVHLFHRRAAGVVLYKFTMKTFFRQIWFLYVCIRFAHLNIHISNLK